MFPHVWDNNKQIRFYTDDYEEMKIISSYLEEDYKFRTQYENVDYRSFMPYYLIITDDYSRIRNLKIISQILQNKNNLGFSLFCLTNDLTQLPNECKTFINLISDLAGMLFENEISSTNVKKFMLDKVSHIDFGSIYEKISNIPIKYNVSGTMLLPNKYTFLEMYDVRIDRTIEYKG